MQKMVRKMYSNDEVQIRQGLVSYIGAIIKSSSLEGKAARQSAAAILIEEAIKLAQEDDNSLNLYVLKPLFRGNLFVLNQRYAELSKMPMTPEVRKALEEYKSAINFLEKLIENAK